MHLIKGHTHTHKHTQTHLLIRMSLGLSPVVRLGFTVRLVSCLEDSAAWVCGFMCVCVYVLFFLSGLL